MNTVKATIGVSTSSCLDYSSVVGTLPVKKIRVSTVIFTSACGYLLVALLNLLRILAMGEVKTAKISNFWTLWPVIQLLPESQTRMSRSCRFLPF